MATLTLVHVLISLLGIASGKLVLYGFLTAKRFDGGNALFLTTTVATSVTGFLFFPIDPFLPSHITGIISLIVLAVALFARYGRHMAGGWRTTYVITVVTALYLNVFVLVVQLFLRVPALHALAPTQSEPPFAIAQAVVLVLFVLLGMRAVPRFRLA